MGFLSNPSTSQPGSSSLPLPPVFVIHVDLHLCPHMYVLLLQDTNHSFQRLIIVMGINTQSGCIGGPQANKRFDIESVLAQGHSLYGDQRRGHIDESSLCVQCPVRLSVYMGGRVYDEGDEVLHLTCRNQILSEPTTAITSANP